MAGAILIVDDNPGDVFLTKRALFGLKANNPLYDVPSGKELIAYLQGNGVYQDRTAYPYPILLLLDIRMPGMDGFDVLLWLRNNPPHSYIPVVVLAGAGDTYQVKRSYELGARSFLTKPVSKVDLENLMEDFLRWSELLRHSFDDPGT